MIFSLYDKNFLMFKVQEQTNIRLLFWEIGEIAQKIKYFLL